MGKKSVPVEAPKVRAVVLSDRACVQYAAEIHYLVSNLDKKRKVKLPDVFEVDFEDLFKYLDAMLPVLMRAYQVINPDPPPPPEVGGSEGDGVVDVDEVIN